MDLHSYTCILLQLLVLVVGKLVKLCKINCFTLEEEAFFIFWLNKKKTLKYNKNRFLKCGLLSLFCEIFEFCLDTSGNLHKTHKQAFPWQLAISLILLAFPSIVVNAWVTSWSNNLLLLMGQQVLFPSAAVLQGKQSFITMLFICKYENTGMCYISEFPHTEP